MIFLKEYTQTFIPNVDLEHRNLEHKIKPKNTFQLQNAHKEPISKRIELVFRLIDETKSSKFYSRIS